MLIGHLYVIFGEMSVGLLPIFLTELFVFSAVEFYGLFVYFEN